MFKPKKILVTGGGGFLGAAVVENLMRIRRDRKLDFEILSMDLLPSPIEGANHHIGSILDITDLMEDMQGCDVVIHLAALLGVENTEKRRLDCLNINIQGTINLLQVAALERVKKFIFSSSSEVYGEQVQMPISEEAPLNPKSIYAITKLAGEEYVRAYSQRYGINFAILRLFNVYGTYQVGQFVIARFVKAVLEDQPPLLLDDGEQIRAFCHRLDVAEAITATIFSDDVKNQVINIGNDQEPVSMRQLAELVLEVARKPHLTPRLAANHESDRSPLRDIRCRIPSIEKAKRLLGYDPKVTLRDGIAEVLEYGKVVEKWSAR